MVIASGGPSPATPLLRLNSSLRSLAFRNEGPHVEALMVLSRTVITEFHSCGFRSHRRKAVGRALISFAPSCARRERRSCRLRSRCATETDYMTHRSAQPDEPLADCRFPNLDARHP